jgi:hypothetical protein
MFEDIIPIQFGVLGAEFKVGQYIKQNGISFLALILDEVLNGFPDISIICGTRIQGIYDRLP